MAANFFFLKNDKMAVMESIGNFVSTVYIGKCVAVCNYFGDLGCV